MPDIDRSVVLEALSALTNSTVRPFSIRRDRLSPDDQLTIENFLPTVFTPAFSVRSLSSSINALTLLDSNNQAGSRASALKEELFVDIDSFLHPMYDYDFTDGPDSDDSECSRGGEPYTRPWGWYRFALKVLDKYRGGNAWLGSRGWRSNSSPGEWPVSFHGTSIEGAKGIARSHYKAGSGQLYGRGIYSTPDIEVADGFVKEFRSQNGKRYSVIMQNRINPKRRIVTADKDFWLIPVPIGTSPGLEKQIVEASIRPYGILIKEV